MIERRVLWTRTARRDLDTIVAYIATDSIQNALSVLDRLRARADSPTTAAESGRLVPKLRSIGVRQYRELVERPWRIIYRIEPDSVMVLAILDGRRELESLLLDRLLRS
jgi:plasmid stabilization system protein ParE